ncbi:hypothetical protein D3C71_1575540 [compost metagenome]
MAHKWLPISLKTGFFGCSSGVGAGVVDGPSLGFGAAGVGVGVGLPPPPLPEPPSPLAFNVDTILTLLILDVFPAASTAII